MSREWAGQRDSIGVSEGGTTRNDRISAILVIVIIATALGIGLIVKQQAQSETWYYESRQAGISASYPAGWLVDETGDSVARIWNPRASRFKTEFDINVVPAGGQTSVRNVLDNLTLQRAANLSAYRVLSVDDVEIGGIPRTQMNFVFVESDPNPFMEHLPVVVLGTDLVFLDGNRAIIVTYMADESSFDLFRPQFERFFASLRY